MKAASVIFEYLAEGGITRLTAIYQQVPNVVGPMRSARFISLKIARHYRGLLFQSGESQATRARAAQDPVPQFFDTFGYQYRTPKRVAPDNLMINGDRVLAAEKNYFNGLASYTLTKARPTLSGGTAATTVYVPEHYSTYKYDKVTGTYTKTEQSHLYKDASLKRRCTSRCWSSSTRASRCSTWATARRAHPRLRPDSSGSVEIYYKGQESPPRGSPPSREYAAVLRPENGQPITLPPGLVWIDVVR